jgi:hypothetical protein
MQCSRKLCRDTPAFDLTGWDDVSTYREKADGKTRIGEIRKTYGEIEEAPRLRCLQIGKGGKRPRPGTPAQGITRARRSLSPHMEKERRQAGRTHAAAEDGGVVDLIIIALLALQVILERLF